MLAFALLSLTATALAATPAPPQLTYLYSANLTFGTTISIGSVPSGKRELLPISGGSFSGPKLSGIPSTSFLLLFPLFPSHAIFSLPLGFHSPIIKPPN